MDRRCLGLTHALGTEHVLLEGVDGSFMMAVWLVRGLGPLPQASPSEMGGPKSGGWWPVFTLMCVVALSRPVFQACGEDRFCSLGGRREPIFRRVRPNTQEDERPVSRHIYIYTCIHILHTVYVYIYVLILNRATHDTKSTFTYSK